MVQYIDWFRHIAKLVDPVTTTDSLTAAFLTSRNTMNRQTASMSFSNRSEGEPRSLGTTTVLPRSTRSDERHLSTKKRYVNLNRRNNRNGRNFAPTARPWNNPPQESFQNAQLPYKGGYPSTWFDGCGDGISECESSSIDEYEMEALTTEVEKFENQVAKLEIVKDKLKHDTSMLAGVVLLLLFAKAILELYMRPHGEPLVLPGWMKDSVVRYYNENLRYEYYYGSRLPDLIKLVLYPITAEDFLGFHQHIIEEESSSPPIL